MYSTVRIRVLVLPGCSHPRSSGPRRSKRTTMAGDTVSNIWNVTMELPFARSSNKQLDIAKKSSVKCSYSYSTHQSPACWLIPHTVRLEGSRYLVGGTLLRTGGREHLLVPSVRITYISCISSPTAHKAQRFNTFFGLSRLTIPIIAPSLSRFVATSRLSHNAILVANHQGVQNSFYGSILASAR